MKWEPKSATKSLRRRLVLSASVLLTILASGCSGSGGGNSAGGGAAPAPGDDSTPSQPNPFEIQAANQSIGRTFNDDDAGKVMNHTGFQIQGASGNNPLEDANVHYATSVGLDGEGATVAIVSDTFNTLHPELYDKRRTAKLIVTHGPYGRVEAVGLIPVGTTIDLVLPDGSVVPDFGEVAGLGIGTRLSPEVNLTPGVTPSEWAISGFSCTEDSSSFAFYPCKLFFAEHQFWLKEQQHLVDNNLSELGWAPVVLANTAGTAISVIVAGRDDEEPEPTDLEVTDARTCSTVNCYPPNVYGLLGAASNANLRLSSYLEADGTWTGFSRITAATNAAKGSVFQANDWSPNGLEDVYVQTGYDTSNLVQRGVVSPTLADVRAQQQSSGDGTAFEQALADLISSGDDGYIAVVYDSSKDLLTTEETELTIADTKTLWARNETLVDGWTEYLAAVKEFGNTGVVAFGLSNDADFGKQADGSVSAPVMAALPEEDEALKDFWLTVGNASETGGLRSSSCGETASYCIMANGEFTTANEEEYTREAEHDTDTRGGLSLRYDPNENQSSVANSLGLVAAATALMAEEFPGLTGKEMRNRLLASANRNFDAFNASEKLQEEVDFGNGVTREVSVLYGHGLLDVKAALLPIGTPGIPTSGNLDSGTQSIANGQFFTSAAVGNAVALSLGDTQLATFDALGTPFYIPAANLIKIDVDDANSFGEELERFAKAGSFMSSEPGDLTDGWQQAFGGAPLATLGNGFMLSPENVAIVGNYQPAKSGGGVSVGWRFHSGSTSVMAQGFGLAPVADEVFANSISILPTDGVSYGAVRVGETSSLGAFAFVEDAGGRFESTGFAFARASALPGGGLGTLGLVMKSEDYAFMGLKSGTSETDDFSGLAGALNFSAQWNLSDQVLGKNAKSGSIFFNAEYGVAESEGAALVQGFDTTTFSGYAVGLRFNEVLNDSDTLTFSVRQPLRVESGAANFRFSQGRDLDRNIAFNDFAASLSPEARQIDFGARYGWNVDASTRVNIGGYYSMNENHIAGEEGGAVMLAISKKL